jgi:hypothetical protein
MHEFIIIFAGLIAHVGLGTNTSQRAVLIEVSSPKHHPKLIVKTTDIDSRPTTGTKYAFKEISGGPTDEIWFNLDGEDVRVVGVPLGKTTTTTRFDGAVVHLQDVTTNVTGKTRKLDSKIIDGDLTHPAVAAFVKYDGGTLDLVSSFKYEAKFTPSLVSQRCLACEVKWTSAKTPSTVVEFVAESGTWVRVSSDATVIVTHLPPDPEDSKHFHMFKSILSNAASISRIDEDTTKPCSPVCDAAKGATIECTNSTWP